MQKKITDEKETGRGGRLFNFRPCLFAVIFLCLGICFSKAVFVSGLELLWGLLVFGVLIPVALVYRNKTAYAACLLLLLSFMIGFCAYRCKAEDFTSAPFYNEEAVVYGRVVEAQESGDGLSLVLDDISVGGKEEKGKLYVKTLFGADLGVRVSDWIFVECDVTTSVSLAGKDAVYPDVFSDDVRFVAVSYGSVSIAGHSFDPFAFLRDEIEEKFYAGMGEDAASVAFAILTGDTTGIEEGLLENVRLGGVAHIFAVSGLHVGTFFGVAVFLCSKVKFLREKKALGFSFVAILLLLYGGVCGYSQSVLRAVITCLVTYAFKLFGVKRDMLEGLSFAAFVLLVCNPAELYCVGFALSFAACYGIAFLAKPLEMFLERSFRALFPKRFENEQYPVGYSRGLRGKIFSFFSVTVSAQAATAPILLNTFGYLSKVGLFLNCLFVPLVGGIFSFTLAFALIAAALPAFVTEAILFLPNVVWSGALLVFETVEFSSVFDGVVLSFSAVVSYYAALLFFSDKFNLPVFWKRTVKTLFCACFLFAFAFCL